MDLLYRLKRHPVPMAAHFRHSLVLTYAFPRVVLEPLLAPGLTLDTWNGLGFLAIALVDTQRMRPTGLPAACGLNARLAGYRIFTRLTGAESRRGLQILRSDTDRLPIAWGGNLLTHYQYRHSQIEVAETTGTLRWTIHSKNHSADLDISADLTATPAQLPSGSPFSTWQQARRFAGPLPCTFDYEPETRSIIRIEGVRQNWTPQPVNVAVHNCTFLDGFPEPQLANAFHVSAVPYRWNRGVREEVNVCSRSFA